MHCITAKTLKNTLEKFTPTRGLNTVLIVGRICTDSDHLECGPADLNATKTQNPVGNIDRELHQFKYVN